MVGAVLGVGMARGISSLNMSVVRGIFMSWIITLPVGGVLDYADARRRLDASPGVARHELVMLSRDVVRFRLFYSGSQEDLRAGVARQSMDLAPNTAGSEAELVLIAPPRVSRR